MNRGEPGPKALRGRRRKQRGRHEYQGGGQRGQETMPGRNRDRQTQKGKDTKGKAGARVIKKSLNGDARLTESQNYKRL